MFFRLIQFAVLLSLLGGCGGTGGTGGGGATDDPLEITVPDTMINYGDRIVVSWAGGDVTRLDIDRYNGTNFAVTENQASGSITDRPAADTIYRVIGFTAAGETVRATLTVKVRPSTKSFLIVGGKSDPLVPQVVSELRKITTGHISWGEKIPSTPVAPVIIILDSGTFGSADEPRIRALLSTGAHLLLVKKSALKLAGVQGDDHDISSISGWFGAATTGYIDHGGYEVVNAVENFPLSLVHIGKNIGGGPDGITIALPVSPSARLILKDEVGRVGAFVYAPPIGGRLAHLGALSFGPSDNQADLRAAFLAECRWLADYQ